MKIKLLIYFIFLATNVSIGTTHIIDWNVGSHIITNIEEGDTFKWKFVGVHDVTSNGSPSFISSSVQDGGSYSVTFTTARDYNYFCSLHDGVNMDGTIIVSPVLGIDDPAPKLSFSIYPNPSSDVLNLKISNNSSNVTIEIFDVLGKNIYKSTAIKQTSINVVNWKTGLYFVKVSFGNNKVTKRFVKE